MALRLAVISAQPLGRFDRPWGGPCHPKDKSLRWAGLKSAYGQQVGRIKLAQRLFSLPDSEARYQQLRNEMIQSYSIGEAELKQLATARANRAKELMLLNQPNIAERIIIGPPKEVTAEQDGIPLGVSLGSKK